MRNSTPTLHTASAHDIVQSLRLRRHIAVLTLIAYIGQPMAVTAEIIADQAAAANKRPVVDTTANGLPLVQIATPGAAGVSHNQYTQFNVDPAGLILNNSQSAVLTLQAGYVSANPNLANGSARIILNEITSTHRSQLNGYTEVAGQQAEVIIANPNGITCNGCGFINTSRGVLTTGMPVMGASGSLDAFRVTGGDIQIGVAGLNGSNLDQLDLIARSIKVNGELWASNLNVITGANLADYNTLGVQVIQGDANKPTVGIDVALLGGMYANKIMLIGTEAGVGVNSQGNLSAQAGDFTLDNQGQITLGGSTTASENLTIAGNTSITNSGTLYSQQAAQLTSAGSITNSGLLSAQGNLTLNAANLNSTGILGAGIDINGNATQNGNLTIATRNQTAAIGTNISGGSMNITATGINLANSNTNAMSGINLNATAGNIDLTSAQTQSAAGDIVLNAAGSVTNNQGSLYGVAITSTSAGFSNTSGSVYARSNLNINSSTSLDNSGQLLAQGDLTLNAATLNSTGILGAGIDINGNATQNGGILITTQNQAIATGTNISGGSMNITATGINLSNSNTNAWNGINLNATAGNIDLTSAQTQSVAGSIALNATGTVNNSAGQLFGAQVSSNAASFNNANGVLGALGNISLTANSINNTNGQIGNALNGAGNITLTATGNLTNTGGQIGSDHDLTVTANTIAGNGQVVAGRDASISLQGNYTNAAGNVFKANRNLTFGTTGNFINQTALEAVGTLSVSAANITNQSGALINANLSNLSATNTLVNQGLLNATSQLTAAANTVSNIGSIIGGNVSLTATQLIENVGTTAFIGASNTTGLLELLAPTIQNRDDTTNTDSMAQTMIYGRGQVILAGAKNALGQYTNATQVLNQSGLIQSEGNISIYADTLTNTRRILQMSNTFSPTGSPVSGTGYWTPGSTVPGGAYPNMAVGGSINSYYLYTSYTGTTSQNSVTNISPAALIVSGGNFTPHVATLKNYWSKVSATGNISLTGVTLDQNSWRGATPYLKRTAYTGDWWYMNYRGFVWSYSCYAIMFLLGTGCGIAWGPQVVDTPLAGYDSSFTANTITATGATISNIGGTSATTPLGAQSPLTQPSVLTLPGGQPASLTLPHGGLYTTNTAPQARYLVETNPAFADRSQWLSSDWYFTHANIDPDIIQKRLGDGFYEQQLVRNELMSLTGRSLLGNYADEQTQFMEMMTSGAKLSMSLKLSPGIGLTADQVAQLTDNVIIMETREVQGQQVLVPIVYLAQISEGELLASGPLIAANNIMLDDTKGFTNSGTLRAGNTLSITGRSIDNRGGNLQSGGLMLLNTVGDIDFTSANIKAGNLALKTGGNLLLNTGARTIDMNILSGGGRLDRSSTMLGRIASMDISGNALIQTGGNFELNGAQFKSGGDLVTDILGNWQIGTQQTRETTTATAPGVRSFTDYLQHTGSAIQIGGKSDIRVGKDFAARGAQIDLQGGGSISAGGNIELTAFKNSFRSDSTGVSKDHYGRNRNYDETLVGTNLQSGQGLTLSSGKDITLSSSTLSVTRGNATLAARGNVNIKADSERHESSIEDTGSSHGLTTTTTRTSRDDTWSTNSIGSNLSGNTISIQSGRDINVTGSNLSANTDITLAAMNDINLLAATETYQETHRREEVTNGLISGGSFGFTVGQDKQTTQTDIEGATQSQSRSRIGSAQGNILLLSGGNTLIAGSDLAATQGDLDVMAGGGIGIFAGLDSLRQYTESHHDQDTGLFSKQRRTMTDTLIQSQYTGSTLAANNIGLDAGADLILQAADVKADKGDTTLSAGGNLQLLSVSDILYSKHTETLQTDGVDILNPGVAFDDRRKINQTTRQTTTAQVTGIQSGGNLTTRSGGNTLIEAGKLDAGGNINLNAGYDANGNVLNPGAAITFAAVKDSDYLNTEDKHSSLSWQSQSGSGHNTETIRLANIKAGKGLNVNATGGIVVDVPEAKTPEVKTHATAPEAAQRDDEDEGDRQPTPEEQAEQRPSTSPGQARTDLDKQLTKLASQSGQEWIARLAKQDNVRYNEVKLAAEHWNYSQEGLTPEAAAVIAIAVTYGTAGVAGSAAGSMTGAAAGTTTVASAVVAAGMTTLASQATISLINNKGHVGKTLEELGRKESVKALITAMATAGALQSLNTALGIQDVNAKSTFTDQLQKNIINQSASAVINHAMYGGDLQQQLEQSLKSAFIDTGAAQGANLIGDLKGTTLNDFTHKLAHAIVGCAAGAAKSNDCSSGALGAVVGEIAAEFYGGNRTGASGPDRPTFKTDTVNFSRLMSGIAALLTGNDVNLAAAAGGNAAENNYLDHKENEDRLEAARGCANGDAEACNIKDTLDALDKARDEVLNLACQGNTKSDACKTATKDMRSKLDTYFQTQNGVQLKDNILSTEEQNAGLGNYTAKTELQSYVNLLAVSNQQRDETQTNVIPPKTPDKYDSDPYRVMNSEKPDLYMVIKVGDQWGVVGKSDRVYTSLAGVNGQSNSINYAPGLMGIHVEREFANPNLYTLYYNPTEGGPRDTWESAQDKAGFTTPVTKKFAQVLGDVQKGDHTVSWVAHSQGGVIFSEAVSFNGGDLSKNRVVFHAGANNRLMTNHYLRKAGINSGNKTQYVDSHLDFVPNVVGLNGNLLEIWGSAIAAPLLFMGPTISPHTLPPKQTQPSASSQGVTP